MRYFVVFKSATTWEQRELGDICEYHSSSLTAKDVYEDGSYDLYDANSLIGKTNKGCMEKDYITIIKDGAGVGRTRLLPKNSMFLGTMGALTPRNSDLDFLYQLITKADLGKTYTGSTIPHIYFKDYGKNIYCIPSCTEQQQIGSYFRNLDNLITLHQRSYNLERKSKTTNAWEQRELGDIVGIYDGVHQTPNYQNSGVMFLSVENIATLKSSKFISEEDFKRDYKVYPQENDILMTRIGDVGTTNVVTDNGLKAYYVSLALLKYKSTDPYFLSNAIQSDYVQKGLANRTLKTAIPMKINKDEIGKVSVMLPLSATEQQEIGSYFRNLDHLITLHQRNSYGLHLPQGLYPSAIAWS